MAKEFEQTRMTINADPDEIEAFFRTTNGDATVALARAPGKRGTEVTLSMPQDGVSYGALRETLRGAKQCIESGEQPTNAHRRTQGNDR